MGPPPPFYVFAVNARGRRRGRRASVLVRVDGRTGGAGPGRRAPAARPGVPGRAVAGWAALLRAFMRRRGVGQMRADADEAAHRFAAQGIVTAGPALLHGVAGILSGDLDEGDAFLEDAVGRPDRRRRGATGSAVKGARPPHSPRIVPCPRP